MKIKTITTVEFSQNELDKIYSFRNFLMNIDDDAWEAMQSLFDEESLRNDGLSTLFDMVDDFYKFAFNHSEE